MLAYIARAIPITNIQLGICYMQITHEMSVMQDCHFGSYMHR